MAGVMGPWLGWAWGGAVAGVMGAGLGVGPWLGAGLRGETATRSRLVLLPQSFCIQSLSTYCVKPGLDVGATSQCANSLSPRLWSLRCRTQVPRGGAMGVTPLTLRS